MSNNGYMKSYRENRKDIAIRDGTCQYHPEVEVEPGYKRCSTCLENDSLRRKKAKLNGVCPSHPSTILVDGAGHCDKCLAAIRNGSKLVKERNVAAG